MIINSNGGEKVKTKRFKISISDGEDGYLVVQCPELRGCISQGKTLSEALSNIKEAVELYLETTEGKVYKVEIEPPVAQAVVE